MDPSDTVTFSPSSLFTHDNVNDMDLDAYLSAALLDEPPYEPDGPFAPFMGFGGTPPPPDDTIPDHN